MSFKYKLILIVFFAALIPLTTILTSTRYFSARTQAVAVDQAEALTDMGLDQVIEGAVNLAEAQQRALEQQRRTAVKSFLRGKADSLRQRASTLFAGLPRQQAWEESRKLILSERIGESGYAFGLDSRGVLIVHKKSEGKSLAGKTHIDEMRQKKEGFITYHSVTANRQKAVYYSYFEPLDLIIAPGVFIDELESLYDKEREKKELSALRELLAATRIGEAGFVWAARAGGPAKGEYVVYPEGKSGLPEDSGELRSFIEAAKSSAPGEILEAKVSLGTPFVGGPSRPWPASATSLPTTGSSAPASRRRNSCGAAGRSPPPSTA